MELSLRAQVIIPDLSTGDLGNSNSSAGLGQVYEYWLM